MEFTARMLLEELPRLASGIVMISMAMWVLASDPSWRVGRAFGIYMVLRGILNLVLPFTDEGSGPKTLDALTILAAYIYVALPFAGIGFAIRYADPGRRKRWGTIAMWSMVGAVLILESILLYDRGFYFSGQGRTYNWLFLSIYVTTLSYAVISVVLFFAHLRAKSALHRRGLLVASISSALFPAFAAADDGMRFIVALATGREITPVAMGTHVTRLITLVGVIALMAGFVWRRSRAGYLLILAALLTGALQYVSRRYWEWSPAFGDAFNGIWTLAMPLGIGYALTRHRLVQLDLVLKWVLAQSLVAGAFVLLFAVIQAAGGALVGPQFGLLLALLCTVMLLFLLTQLQDFGEAIARRVLPDAQRPEDMDEEARIRAYREQVLLSRAEGHRSRGERSLLRNLRKTLEISDDVARAVEAEADAS